MPQPRQKTSYEYDGDIARGNEANALLANPLLTEVLDKIETDAVAEMVEEKDSAKRDELWHRVRAVRTLKLELQNIGTTGKMAARNKKAAGGV